MILRMKESLPHLAGSFGLVRWTGSTRLPRLTAVFSLLLDGNQGQVQVAQQTIRLFLRLRQWVF